MADLSAFKRDQILGARKASARVTKSIELFGATLSTVSKIMTAFEIEGKASSLKQNSRSKWKQSERDRWINTWIVWNDHKNTAPKITAEINDHLGNLVSPKIVRRELHKAHGKAAIRKPY